MFDIGTIIGASNIEQILIELGISSDRRRSSRGYELYFKCINPNHDSEHKKMSIAEDGRFKGLFNCWSCRFKGNILQLIQYVKNCPFKDALFWLRDRTGVGDLIGIDSLKYRIKSEKLNYGLTDTDTRRAKLTTTNPKGITDAASAYLANRGISQETIRKFQVYNSEHKDIGSAITIPIFFTGELTSIYFGEARDGGLKRYPRHAPNKLILFNYDEAVQGSSYILVESILDVLRLDSLGLGPGVACFSNMVSEEQLELLRPFKEHAVFPDMDSPRGWDLVDRMVEGLDKSVWLVIPPIGKDPGDCTVDEIVQSYAQRQRYSDWEVDRFISKVALKSVTVNSLRKK